jgi:DNA-binding YbaB/EbfC family protein
VDIKKMMQQAQEMQEKLQRQMTEMRISATAGGGMVIATVNGNKQLLTLQIDPEVVSKDDVEMLQDLIVAAINDAHRKVDEALASQMQGMMGGLAFESDAAGDPVRAGGRAPAAPGIGTVAAPRVPHLRRSRRHRRPGGGDAVRRDKVTSARSAVRSPRSIRARTARHPIATAGSFASSSSRRMCRRSRKRTASRAAITCSWARSRRFRASDPTI